MFDELRLFSEHIDACLGHNAQGVNRISVMDTTLAKGPHADKPQDAAGNTLKHPEPDLIKRVTLSTVFGEETSIGRSLLGDYVEPPTSQDVFTSMKGSPYAVPVFRKDGCTVGAPVPFSTFDIDEDDSPMDGLAGLAWTNDSLDLMRGFAASPLFDSLLKDHQVTVDPNSSVDEKLIALALKLTQDDSAVEEDLPGDIEVIDIEEASSEVLEFLVNTHLAEDSEGLVCNLIDDAPSGFVFSGPSKSFDTAKNVFSENVVSKLDKVTNRLIAETIGILKQPRFVDVRSFNQVEPSVSYSKIDLSEFPVNSVLASPENVRRYWVVENMAAGFCICNDSGYVYALAYNPQLQDVIKRHSLHIPSMDVSRETLVSFLDEVGSLPNMFIRPLSRAGEEHSKQRAANELARFALSHEGSDVYLKSSRTAGGDAVIKISRDADGHVQIECNGSELNDLVVRKWKLFTDNIGPHGIEALAKISAKDLTPESLLTGLISGFMNAPILEEQINMAPCNGGRAEPRLIYQLDADGVLQRTAEYCKFSPSQVAANVALGGCGLDVRDALHTILAPLVSGDRLKDTVSATFAELCEKCDEFAERWYEKSPTLYPEFALDTGLVWNEGTQSLDFYLVEVQRKFAFAGLEQIDATRAAQVRANQERIAELVSSRGALTSDFKKLTHSAVMGRVLQLLRSREPESDSPTLGDDEN